MQHLSAAFGLRGYRPLLLTLVLALLLLPRLGWAQDAPLSSVLNPDGTLRPGAQGSFSAKGYQLSYGPGGQPVLRAAAAAATEWTGLGGGAPGTRNGTNGPVYAVVISGSTVYVGGNFTMAGGVAARNVAKWDGTTWSALGAGIGSENVRTAGVLAMVMVGNRLYVGGDFYSAGGVETYYIAQWNGTAWSGLRSFSFRSTNGIVNALAAGPNGEVYAGGGFTQLGGVDVSGVAKWNGSTWSPLGAGVNYVGWSPVVYALTASGNDLYVGGAFNRAGGLVANNVAKWDGSSWSSLGTGTANGAETTVTALAASGTTVYVGGFFASAGGVSASKIAKWDGSAWSPMGTGPFPTNGTASSVQSLAITSTGEVYAGGPFTHAGGMSTNKIAKWNGTSWSALGTGSTNGVSGGSVHGLVAVGNTLYVGGAFSQVGEKIGNYIATWDGAQWNSLGTDNGTNNSVQALAVSGRNVYVGGSFTAAGPAVANYVAQWDGTTWRNLGAGAANGLNNTVRALAVGGSGELYAGGDFTLAGGTAANYVAQWNGTAWQSLGTGAATTAAPHDNTAPRSLPGQANGLNGQVRALAVRGTTLYAGGVFTQAGGLAANRVAQWDGSTWSALGTGTANGANNTVSALALDNGILYAGGDFTAVNEIPSAYVAQWDGTQWSSLGTGAANGVGGAVRALAASGGTLYVGGAFATAGGVAARNLAQWNGATWSSLGKEPADGVNGEVRALALNGSTLYAAGAFSTAGDTPANRVAQWDGTTWSSLGTGTANGLNNTVNALALSSSGLLVGGAFAQAGGNEASFVAAFLPAAIVPLPVELAQFTAQAEGPAAVRLRWTTITEHNSRAFEVERSQDGTAFVSIGTVAAAGTSAATRRYGWLDAQRPATTLYYRLRQVDTDGSYSYSPVRVVQATVPALSLFPNPAQAVTTLTGAQPGGTVQVFDALGRPVLTAQADAAGTAQLRLPAQLRAGVYMVRSSSQTVRLLVP